MMIVLDSLCVCRCLGPFLVETVALVEAGVGLEQLDKVVKDYGLPVGPITLADEVSQPSIIVRPRANSVQRRAHAHAL